MFCFRLRIDSFVINIDIQKQGGHAMFIAGVDDKFLRGHVPLAARRIAHDDAVGGVFIDILSQFLGDETRVAVGLPYHPGHQTVFAQSPDDGFP